MFVEWKDIFPSWFDYGGNYNRKFTDNFFLIISGIVECDQPIETLSHRIGICIVSPNGKSCRTTFERLNFNGKSSTVLCKPITGRMHQIRVHLQYLGHPIINDHFYNSPAFGEQKGRLGEYGKSIDQVVYNFNKKN